MKQQALEALKKSGWHIKVGDGDFQLPSSLAERYPRLPQPLIDFLSSLIYCRNAKETAWFLCQMDYEGRSEGAFCWNEFELMDMALDGEDAAFLSSVKSFWDNHFPFFLSVKSGYSYFAVSVQDHNLGAVVHAYEPEFTDATQQAASFDEFLTLMLEAIENPDVEGLLQAAI